MAFSVITKSSRISLVIIICKIMIIIIINFFDSNIIMDFCWIRVLLMLQFLYLSSASFYLTSSLLPEFHVTVLENILSHIFAFFQLANLFNIWIIALRLHHPSAV